MTFKAIFVVHKKCILCKKRGFCNVASSRINKLQLAEFLCQKNFKIKNDSQFSEATVSLTKKQSIYFISFRNKSTFIGIKSI